MIKMRKTMPLIFVIRELSQSPRLCGIDIRNRTGVPSGTLYPILYRLEERGGVKSTWEVGDPVKLGRPLRRFYRLTKAGKALAAEIERDLEPVARKRLQRGQNDG